MASLSIIESKSPVFSPATIRFIAISGNTSECFFIPEDNDEPDSISFKRNLVVNLNRELDICDLASAKDSATDNPARNINAICLKKKINVPTEILNAARQANQRSFLAHQNLLVHVQV